MVRRWTWEREVWGSIPGTLDMHKILGQDLNLHCLWPPSSNGYLVERKIEIVWMASAALIALHSSHEDETVKVWVPIPGGNLCEVRWTLGDIWTINMHLYLTFISHDKSNHAGAVRMWISPSKQHSLCGEYSERIRICVCLRIFFILNLVYTCSVFPFSIKSAMCSIYISDSKQYNCKALHTLICS